MNRSVLARQMFAAGGAALKPISAGNAGLPNLPESVRNNMGYMQYGGAVGMQMGGEPQMALGDYLGGQTDELAAEAARLGISKEQLLELLNQQAMQPQPQAQPVGMAMGGDPAMAQGVGSMMPPPPAMPEGQGMAEGVMDPQVLEGLLGQAQQNMDNLDDAEDYATVINSIRGEDAPIEARYEELAGIVGEEDAAQTPESVLTLVQPAIMMGGVDEGIGGLAQAEMTEPVEGAMAGGIMSTVAPPPPAAPMPPAGMGGPPPVNFNQGGLVRRGDNQPVKMMQAGGDPRLMSAFEGKLPVYEQVLGDPTAQLEEQKNLTQAQMLFDIAGTALAFAAPMQGETAGMSAAERLAMAATQTKLLPTIGARAQQQQDRKSAAETAKQGIRASALTAAEAQLTAADKAETERKKLAIEQGYRVSNILLEQTGSMELAESQANWKAALQDDQQLAAEALKKLDGVQGQEAIKLRKKLENQNAIRLKLLAGEQALEQIGLQGMNAIAKQDKAHIQALTIQENNQALSREQKRIDVGLETINQQIRMDGNDLKKAAMLQQANAETRRFSLDEKRLELEQKGLENTAQYRANQLAIAYADQDIKEAKMLQDADAATQQQVLAQKKLALEERGMLVKEAAAGLDKFGKGLEGKLLGKLTDVEKLKLYESGDLGEQETTDLEASMLRYTDIGPVFDETLGRMVVKPARKLPDRVVRARAAREAAGFRVAPLGGSAAATDATGAATTATTATTATDAAASTTTALGTDVTQQDVGAFPTGDDINKTTYSSLLDEIDVSDAFGAPTAFGEFLNRGVELVSLGTAQAAPDAAKSTAIIESINQNATLIYLEAVKGRADKELRKEIQSKLPEPSALTKGEKSAYNKAKATVAFLNSKIDPIELELRSPKGVDVGKRRNALASLKSVRDTYAKLADKLEAIVDPKPKPPRSNQAVSNDLFGDSDG